MSESDTFKDSQYYQSLMGMGSNTSYGNFLAGLTPPERAKYIRKSARRGVPGTHLRAEDGL